MEFEPPAENKFTVYSKSGCNNCVKIKNVLKEKNHEYNTVDCDEYIIEEKDNFLQYIEKLAEKELKTFPIVFFNKKYIGGYKETIDYIEKHLFFDYL